MFFSSIILKSIENSSFCLVIVLRIFFVFQELEAERTKLLEDVSTNKRKMKELEDNLLYRLTSTKVMQSYLNLRDFFLKLSLSHSLACRDPWLTMSRSSRS